MSGLSDGLDRGVGGSVGGSLGRLLNLLGRRDGVGDGSDGIGRGVSDLLDRRQSRGNVVGGVRSDVGALDGGSSDLVLGRKRLRDGLGGRG
jgi:hypothetical protein